MWNTKSCPTGHSEKAAGGAGVARRKEGTDTGRDSLPQPPDATRSETECLLSGQPAAAARAIAMAGLANGDPGPHGRERTPHQLGWDTLVPQLHTVAYLYYLVLFLNFITIDNRGTPCLRPCTGDS